MPLSRIAVFCGSSAGNDARYVDAACAVGKLLVREQIGLVYGGGDTGLMGAVADSVIAGGGEVVGVIPHGLVVKEVAHAGLAELHVVDTMHERKALMADLADGFLTLPGGMGTLDETFEILTWAQLGIHHKPCGVLNVAGYFDPLLAMLDHMVRGGLLRPEHRSLALVDDDAARLLARMRSYEAPAIPAWVRLEDR